MSDHTLRICRKNILENEIQEKLADIVFYNGSQGFELNIQDDITPKESVEITIMITMGLNSYIGYNWEKIIKDKKLERHFIKVKKSC